MRLRVCQVYIVGGLTWEGDEVFVQFRPKSYGSGLLWLWDLMAVVLGRLGAFMGSCSLTSKNTPEMASQVAFGPIDNPMGFWKMADVFSFPMLEKLSFFIFTH